MLSAKSFPAGIMLVLALVSCSAEPAAQTTPLIVPTPIPRPTATAIERPRYRVARGEVTDKLVTRARVAPATDEDVFFTQNGFVKAVYVQRFDQVEKGQLLAELDSGTLPDQIAQVQSRFAAAQQDISVSAEQRQLAIRKAQLELDAAQARLEELRQPPDQDDVSAARLKVEQARMNLEETRRSASIQKTQAQLSLELAANAVRDAQDAYSRLINDPEAAENNKFYAEEVEKAKRAIENAQANVQKALVAYESAREAEVIAVQDAEKQIEEAQLALETVLAGTDPDEIAAADRAVRAAQVRLSEARVDAAGPKLQQAAQQARLDLDELQGQLEGRRVYAPFSGSVSEVGVRPGDSVEAFSPVINIMDASRLELVIDGLLAADLNRLSLGQQVDIAFDRYAGQMLNGTIDQLPASLTSTSSSVASDPAVRVRFDQNGLDLQVGDLSTATIVLGTVPNALWLPPDVVYKYDGGHYVVVPDGDGVRRLGVRVGINSVDRIQIVEGLQEGDVVYGD